MKLWTDEEMQERIEHVRKMLEDNREEFERRSKAAEAAIDWSTLEGVSVFCGNHSTWKYDCNNLYVFDRKSGKYIKGGK